MNTTRPAPAPTSFAPAATWPNLSADRAAGIAWYERLMAQARPSDSDAARFVARLAG